VTNATPTSPTHGHHRLPRICLLTETYHPVVGGGERQAQSLAEDLAAHGFKTIIITRQCNVGLKKVEAIGRVVVSRVAPTGVGGTKRWLMLVPSFLAMVKARRDYDIIFVSGFKALGISAVLAAKLLSKRSVLKADSNGEMSGEFFSAGLRRLRMSPAGWPFRLFLAVRNSVLRRADCFVALTTRIAHEYTRQGVRPAAIHPIPNSVDTNTFRPVAARHKATLRRRLKLPEKKFLASYAGRLVSYKGLPLLLRVAQEIQRERDDVGFVLIGSGGLDTHNCEAALKDYVADNALESCVHFAGEVRNVHEFLQASDVFVLPTEDEAFGLALIEAMACGLPVVTTSVGGIPEVVSHGETGLLVEPNNFQELRNALEHVMKDPAMAASLGQAARRTVEARYCKETVASRYMELFASVHQDRRAGSRL
jgi:glycosyltransferase involved in cell wall biosynthesis